MSSSDDTLRRAYSRLGALKENLPKGYYVGEDYVREYHEILSLLEEPWVQIDEFKISSEQVVPVVTSVTDGEATYSGHRYIERTYFLVKLDGLLAYFTLTYDERKPRIGFSVSP